MSPRPNILFVISDQHNAKVLGHAGHPDVRTPHLDRLASEGVRFVNAVTQNPICTPSRVSFLSGQYCHNHGYYGLSGPNPQGLPSVLGHFRKHGYRTGAFGKIHCPENWVEDDADEFAEVYENCSVGLESPYSEYLKEKDLFHLRDDAATYGRPQEIKKQFQQFDGRVSNLAYEDTVEAWVARRTIEFMEGSVKDEQPFIVQASLPRPHARYTPSEPFWSMYDEGEISLPPNVDHDMQGKAPNLRQMAERYSTGDWTLFDPPTHEAGRLRKLHGYLGCVSQVDQAVGDLLDWLDQKNLAENTIVVYTTDHGDYACEHGIMEKAPGISSDAITRIPYIWRFPGHAEGGKTVHETVEAVDTATTMCSLAGIEPMETADGKDITKALSEGRGDPDRIGVTEFAWSRSIRWDRFRFVYYPREMFASDYPDGFAELYDTQEDPWEMNNLYFEEEHRVLAQKMKDRLFDWLVTTTRPITTLGVRSGSGGPGHLEYEDQRVTRFGNTVNHDGKIHPNRLRESDPSGQNYL
jgi:arylsulfatase